MADSTTGSGSNTQDINQLLGQSPFGRLLDIEKADGSKVTAQDIFGNVGAGGGSLGSGGASFNQDSPYGGNPFAGDNFWNIFAGGVNPSNISGNPASSGGGAPSGNPASYGGGFSGGGAPSGNPASSGGGFSGGGTPSGNPASSGGGFSGGGAPSGSPASSGGGFSGGGAPSGNPASSGGGFSGGGAPGGSPSPTTGENTQDLNELLSQSPFAPLLDIEKADGSKVTAQDIFGNVNLPASSIPLGNGGDPFAGDNFWNTFGGGVNPTTFSSSDIPAFGGGSPQGLPTGASTPVPEPSSVIGIAVIGVGIAATKFRQYQRRTVKAFNK